MKKLSVLLIGLTMLGTSCSKDSTSGSSDTLGGSTSIALNTVGNEFKGSVKINGSNYVAGESMKITSVSSDGVATITCSGNVPSSSPLKTLIPSQYINSAGRVSGNLKIKQTSEGIQDYTNSDGKPQILVKYDAAVGDKYVVEKSNGTKITRTVTAKSTTNDFNWGGMMIKTITVEQDSRIPGINKIVYQINHKYGVVTLTAIMSDGTSSEVILNPTSY